MYQIYSYNVNGIRAAVTKGFITWLKETNPDIIGLQEIKANPEDFPKNEIEALGYHVYTFSAEKKGYSGVAILSKNAPKSVEIGCGNPFYDSEGRVLIAHYDGFSVINTYFPSGSSGDVRQEIKMEFLDFYPTFIENLRMKSPNLIVLGDYNIAHKEIDIHDPKGNKKSSGFLPEERAWMDRWFASGMRDSFRLCHPEQKDIYSWWTYRAGARPKNKGWRIDYISVAESLVSLVKEAKIHTDVFHSDHCPISISIDI